MSTPSDLAGITLSVTQAAARVGLTPATLRTWDRRYGISPTGRTPGGHRRYTERDLARLRRARDLVDDGVPPANAVALALGNDVPAQSTPRAGGGRVLALPDATEQQRGLGRAAMSMDEAAMRDTLSRALTAHGVVATWTDLIVPVLQAIGERWERTAEGVEVEHVAAAAVAAALNDHCEPVPTTGRPVLLATVPEEQHSLPMMALHAALSEERRPSVFLGARVPRGALIDSVKRVRPGRIVLWAQQRALADVALVEELPTQRPAAKVILAGPGWAPLLAAPGSALAGFPYARSLQEALDLVGSP